MTKKCIVDGCKNTNDKCHFYNDLCSQCHAFITGAGTSNFSQATKNALRTKVSLSRLTMIESPYKDGDRDRNLRYLGWCEYHSALCGELPISSHGNCPVYWPEDEQHRAMGFAWRDAIRSVCGRVVYYQDLGISAGMRKARERDSSEGIHHLNRSLPFDLLERFSNGEDAPGSMVRRAK